MMLIDQPQTVGLVVFKDGSAPVVLASPGHRTKRMRLMSAIPAYPGYA